MPQNIGTTASPSQTGRGTLRSMPLNVSSDANTGAAFVSFPLPLTQSRELTPSLSLNYHANQGNGVFGVGMDISGVLNITRSTSRGGVPQYNDATDIFILSNAGELVKISDDGTTVKYRPRLESQFSDVSYNKTSKTWLIREANGINHTLGGGVASRITNLDETKIYQWWVSETVDARGNKIKYTYTKNGAEFSLSQIQYGNYHDAPTSEKFAFCCQLDYGDSDATQKDADGKPLWLKNTTERPDKFTHYRAGFAITESQLCQRITLTHALEGKNYLVKYWQLSYQPTTAHSAVSLMQQIQEIGCRSNSNDQYITQSLPPASLDFFLLENKPKAMQRFALKGTSLPGTPGDYQWVDLYRDGLPGILYNDGVAAKYWRSEGNGKFSAPRQVSPFPYAMDFASPTQCRIMHLGREKKTAFVVADDQLAGYYLLDETKLVANPEEYTVAFSKQQFFQKYPIEFIDPSNEVMDLNGNGGNDLVVLDVAHPYYYPESDTAGAGYEAYKLLTLPTDFPRHGLDPNSLVTFTDIFGDGLMHRVRINRDGITIWPNVGNGSFAAKIHWRLPTLKTTFDPGSVFLVDIDGTGATDFVYAYADHVEVFLNQGQGFAGQSFSFSFPETYTHQDQLIFSDMLGSGFPSVIFIKKDINEIRYYTGSFALQKPYLLKAVTQSSGLQMTFSYETSAKAYLADRKTTMPSIRLPFVLPILSSMTTLDPLTKVSLTKTYDYHYGEYNFSERRFCGFAYVEETRSESLGEAKQIQDRQVKTWFFNRASSQAKQAFATFDTSGLTANDLDTHYYKEDESSDGEPWNVSENSLLAQEIGFALHGQVLRQEVWGGQSDFFTNKPLAPITIALTHYNIRCDYLPQASAQQQHAILVLQSRESYHLSYEQHAEEPQVVQEITLRFDAANNPLITLKITYGRQNEMTVNLVDSLVVDDDTIAKLIPLQTVTRAIYQQNSYAKVSETNDFRFLHLLAEVKLYDVSAILPEKNPQKQTFAGVKAAVETPTVLLQQHRQYYWNDEQTKVCSLNESGKTALPHHQRSLLGDETQVEDWYRPVSTAQQNLDPILMSVGYLKEQEGADNTANWWQPDEVKHYGNPTQYYQLIQITQMQEYDGIRSRGLFKNTVFFYDEPYYLSLTKISRYLAEDNAFSTQMLIDYQSMKPYQVIDENQNTHVSLVDALGRPMASTQYGQLEDEWIGNPLNDTPEESLTASQLMNVAFDLIQQLKGLSLNDLSVNSDAKIGRWLRIYAYSELSSQPRYTVELVQRNYDRRAMPILTTAPARSIGFQVSYVDSFGQPLQVKHRTDETVINKKWLCSGTSIYSASGRLLQQSLPSYRESAIYEQGAGNALLHYYDANVNLLQQTLLDEDGDQHQREIIRTAWYQVYYDQNVMQNKQDSTKKYPSATIVQFQDAAANTVGQLKIASEGAADRYRLSCSTFDVLGRAISHQDARLSKPNLTIAYNLLGKVVSRSSVDAGAETYLHNHQGTLKRRHRGEWIHRYEHDSWQRLLVTRVFSQTQAPIAIERRIYGEMLGSPQKTNACGQLISFANEVGLTVGLTFDLNAECIKRRRRVFLPKMSLNVETTLSNDGKPQPYRQVSLVSADWNIEVFDFSTEYDALGNLLAETLPNGRVNVRQYNALAQLTGIQSGVDLSHLTPVVSNMKYQATGLRTEVKLGAQLDKGITTTYEYDLATQRLTYIQSFDAKNNKLQEQTYEFDPVGNLISLASDARRFATSATSVGAIDAATQQYTYDDFYRLVSAEGLEMPVKPIGSDAQVIPQQYFSTGVSFALEPYSQRFTYDLSDNLTQIHHAHKDGTFWALDFSVKSDSNQFATLTSTKDNSVVPLAAGESLYDTAGNMQKLDADTDLSWDHTNQLRQTTVDRSATAEGQVKEYYGYRGTAFQDVPFSDSPGDRAAYNPGFFGSSRAAKHPTIDPKPFAEYGNRLYKITCFLKADKSIEVIEQVFLGGYERKRIVSISSDPTAAPTTTLIRHTLHLHDDDVMMATHHSFELDINAREASQPVVQGDIPIEQWQYHLTDHLKSSVLALDDEGNVLSVEGYQPYGQIGFIMTRDAKQLSLQDYHYSSEIRDEVTGLYYYGARSYAPQFGRWLSPDPAGLVDGLNLYGFVRNNPMSYWDWWGFGDEEKEDRSGFCFAHRSKYLLDVLMQGGVKPSEGVGGVSLSYIDDMQKIGSVEKEAYGGYYEPDHPDPAKIGDSIFSVKSAFIWREDHLLNKGRVLINKDKNARFNKDIHTPPLITEKKEYNFMSHAPLPDFYKVPEKMPTAKASTSMDIDNYNKLNQDVFSLKLMLYLFGADNEYRTKVLNRDDKADELIDKFSRDGASSLFSDKQGIEVLDQLHSLKKQYEDINARRTKMRDYLQKENHVNARALSKSVANVFQAHPVEFEPSFFNCIAKPPRPTKIQLPLLPKYSL